MPVDARVSNVIYQREAYKKSFITRLYWDYKDSVILSKIPNNAQKILDLGCGEGIMLERLINRFPHAEIEGYDLNNENIEICKALNLPVKYGDICRLDIDDNSIDCILFIEVIEHMHNYTEALQEIYRVLKPGGVLVLMYPNDTVFKFLRTMMLRHQEANLDYGHVMQWHPELMLKMAGKQGFKNVSHKFLPFVFWNLSLHALVTMQK
jgi:ubiquinone/menaquinone biosynthesis C-methylase UbiE